MMSAFVEVTVMGDAGNHSTRAIRASDVYEIEDCSHYRVIRRKGIDDLFVIDDAEALQMRIESRSNFACGGCK